MRFDSLGMNKIWPIKYIWPLLHNEGINITRTFPGEATKVCTEVMLTKGKFPRSFGTYKDHFLNKILLPSK